MRRTVSDEEAIRRLNDPFANASDEMRQMQLLAVKMAGKSRHNSPSTGYHGTPSTNRAFGLPVRPQPRPQIMPSEAQLHRPLYEQDSMQTFVAEQNPTGMALPHMFDNAAEVALAERLRFDMDNAPWPV